MREAMVRGSAGAVAKPQWRSASHPARLSGRLAALLAAIAAAALVAALLGQSSQTGHGVPVARDRAGAGSGLPVEAELAAARGIGADQREYWARRAPGGLVARSASLNLRERFGPGRVAVETARGNVELSLLSVGRLSAPSVAPIARRNVVSYRRHGLTEWYANGPMGLEQGLTIPSAGLAAASRGLTFAFGIAGTLQPRLRRGSVAFVDRGGQTVLQYADLRVTDARDRRLPASVGLRRGRLILRVDAAGARYPIKVDPLLTPSTGDGTASLFGQSVATSDTTIVVGAENANQFAGAVYVFVKPASGWQDAHEAAVLTDPTVFGLGTSVAVSGSTVVAGAPNSRAVDVFSEPAGGWTSVASPTAQLTAQGDDLGRAVAIDGATIVAGSPFFGSGTVGVALIYSEPAGGWATTDEPTASLAAADPAPGAQLGFSVAISGSTVVAGAMGANSFAGAAYVFTEPAGGWVTETDAAKLTGASIPSSSLGTSVAVSGTTVVAGAPNTTVSGQDQAGAAFVYVQPPSGWVDASENALLTSSSPAPQDLFAQSVAVNGSTVVAADQGVANPGGQGSVAGVWQFSEPPGGWSGNPSGPAALTYAGDSAFSTSLLSVQTDGTQVLGLPGNGQVNVICPAGNCAPPAAPGGGGGGGGGAGGGGGGGSPPTKTTTQPPPPKPAVPPPVLFKSVDAVVISGIVLIKEPGQKKFTRLKAGERIPLRSIVDATRGRVKIVAAIDNHGHVTTGVFYSGEFRITQTRDGKRVLAVLTLVGPKPTGCPARSAVTAKGKKKKVKRRLLWGNTKGDFRTVGTYASATERGTIWLTQDQCSGTLIKVTADSVTLVDFSHHHRAVVVKAGHSFLAHPGKGG